MLVGRSLLALSAFRLPALRYSALPRHITANRFETIKLHKRALMSNPSAAVKRVHEGINMESTGEQLGEPSLKRQKSNAVDNTDSVVPDVPMADIASESSPASVPPQRAESGAAQVEVEGVEADAAQVDVAPDSPSSSKAKKSDAGRPRRSKKNNKDEEGNKKKPARNRRRATKEEEEAARERKAKAEAEGTAVVRYPKRQSALLIGFCGSGYSGMQMCVLHFCFSFNSCVPNLK